MDKPQQIERKQGKTLALWDAFLLRAQTSVHVVALENSVMTNLQTNIDVFIRHD